MAAEFGSVATGGSSTNDDLAERLRQQQREAQQAREAAAQEREAQDANKQESKSEQKDNPFQRETNLGNNANQDDPNPRDTNPNQQNKLNESLTKLEEQIQINQGKLEANANNFVEIAPALADRIQQASPNFVQINNRITEQTENQRENLLRSNQQAQAVLTEARRLESQGKIAEAQQLVDDPKIRNSFLRIVDSRDNITKILDQNTKDLTSIQAELDRLAEQTKKQNPLEATLTGAVNAQQRETGENLRASKLGERQYHMRLMLEADEQMAAGNYDTAANLLSGYSSIQSLNEDKLRSSNPDAPKQVTADGRIKTDEEVVKDARAALQEAINNNRLGLEELSKQINQLTDQINGTTKPLPFMHPAPALSTEQKLQALEQRNLLQISQDRLREETERLFTAHDKITKLANSGNLTEARNVAEGRSAVLGDFEYPKNNESLSKRGFTRTKEEEAQYQKTVAPELEGLQSLERQLGILIRGDAKNKEGGLEAKITDTKKDINDSGILSSWGGRTEALEKTLAAEKSNKEGLEKLEEAVGAVKSRVKDLISQGRYEDANSLLQSSNKAISQGFQSANSKLIDAYSGVNKELEQFDRKLKDTSVQLAKVAAITIVAASLAPVTGGGSLAALTALGTGTLAGIGAGIVIDSVDAAVNVGVFDESLSQAASRVVSGENVYNNSKTAFLAALGGSSGTQLATRLKDFGAITQTIGAAGGTSAMVSAVDLTEQRIQAELAYNAALKSDPNLDKEKFMEERGMTVGQIAKTLTVNTTVGILSGLVGLKAGAAREGMKTATSKVATDVVEETASAIVGLAGTFVNDGKLTAQSIVDEGLSAFQGRATGHRIANSRATKIESETNFKLNPKINDTTTRTQTNDHSTETNTRAQTTDNQPQDGTRIPDTPEQPTVQSLTKNVTDKLAELEAARATLKKVTEAHGDPKKLEAAGIDTTGIGVVARDDGKKFFFNPEQLERRYKDAVEAAKERVEESRQALNEALNPSIRTQTSDHSTGTNTRSQTADTPSSSRIVDPDPKSLSKSITDDVEKFAIPEFEARIAEEQSKSNPDKEKIALLEAEIEVLKEDLETANKSKDPEDYRMIADWARTQVGPIAGRAKMIDLEQRASSANPGGLKIQTANNLPDGVQGRTTITEIDGVRQATVELRPGIEEKAKAGDPEALKVYLEEMRHAGVTKLIDAKNMSQAEYQARRAFEELGAEVEANKDTNVALFNKVPSRRIHEAKHSSAMAELAGAYDAPHASPEARELAISKALAEVKKAGLITNTDLANYDSDYRNAAEGKDRTQVGASATETVRKLITDINDPRVQEVLADAAFGKHPPGTVIEAQLPTGDDLGAPKKLLTIDEAFEKLASGLDDEGKQDLQKLLDDKETLLKDPEVMKTLVELIGEPKGIDLTEVKARLEHLERIEDKELRLSAEQQNALRQAVDDPQARALAELALKTSTKPEVRARILDFLTAGKDVQDTALRLVGQKREGLTTVDETLAAATKSIEATVRNLKDTQRQIVIRNIDDFISKYQAELIATLPSFNATDLPVAIDHIVNIAKHNEDVTFSKVDAKNLETRIAEKQNKVDIAKDIINFNTSKDFSNLAKLTKMRELTEDVHTLAKNRNKTKNTDEQAEIDKFVEKSRTIGKHGAEGVERLFSDTSKAVDNYYTSKPNSQQQREARLARDGAFNEADADVGLINNGHRILSVSNRSLQPHSIIVNGRAVDLTTVPKSTETINGLRQEIRRINDRIFIDEGGQLWQGKPPAKVKDPAHQDSNGNSAFVKVNDKGMLEVELNGRQIEGASSLLVTNSKGDLVSREVDAVTIAPDGKLYLFEHKASAHALADKNPDQIQALVDIANNVRLKGSPTTAEPIITLGEGSASNVQGKMDGINTDPKRKTLSQLKQVITAASVPIRLHDGKTDVTGIFINP